MNKTSCIILCGGKGTRFQEVSTSTPKVLAIISGRPLLDILVDQIKNAGITEIILAVGHLSHKVKSHVKSYKGINIRISEEFTPLGTGGATLQAISHCTHDRILVMNGDSYINESLKDIVKHFINKVSKFGMVLSYSNDNESYGNVTIDEKGLITSFREKPLDNYDALINSGIYYLQKKYLRNYELKKTSLERDLIPVWLAEYGIHSYVSSSEVYDIGTLERYKIASKNLIND